MDSKKRLQISVIIGATALLLILALVVGILLMPNSNGTPLIKDNQQNTAPVAVQKYDVTGRIFAPDGTPLANTKFSIDLGPTDFTTDENGFFILKNLPVGQYTISAYDNDGNRIASTLVQLSTDGAFSVGSYSFELGELVTLCFDGEKFFAVIVKEDAEIGADGTEDKLPEKEEIESPQIDETYTNLSWMKDLPMECGAYHLDYYWNQELTDAVLADESFEYFDTYVVCGRNIEIMKRSTETLTKAGKKVWLSVYDLIYNKSADKSQNLKGNWRNILDKYASVLKEIAGGQFQGIYFDEPSHRITSTDFLRVTQYCRETYNCRVWAIHASPAFLTPYSRGKDIVGYKPSRFDPMVISAENHAYVTDVGWWRYGGHRFFGDFKVAADEFAKAMTMLHPDTRKWIVPVLGTYDWRHDEEDVLTNQYRFIDLHKDLQGFGGVMFYSMWHGSAFDAAKVVTYEEYEKRLVEEDFLKENGYYVYSDYNGKKAECSNDGKYECAITVDEVVREAYMTVNEKGDEIYYYKNENGEFVEFYGDLPASEKLSRVINLHVNNSPCPLPDRFIEGYGSYFIFDKQADGTVRWPTVRKYVDVIGKGIKNGTDWNVILKQLGEVYMPDVSLFDGKNSEEVEEE